MAILDIRTGKPIAATTTRRKVLTGLAGILATGTAPAAFIRSAIAARMAAWSGGESQSIWIDGYGINRNVLFEDSSLSVSLYIPATSFAGHSVEASWGSSALNNCTWCEYNANKIPIDYTSENNATRTITVKARAIFVRFAIQTSYKDNVFLYDNTTGEYIIKDGKLVADLDVSAANVEV